MSNSDSRVVASVLNWNNFSDTAKCIRSLERIDNEHFDIIIVDNGSTDGSVEQLAEEFPDYKLIRNSINRGFSGGHNKTIRYAIKNDIDYIWILNNDIFVTETCLETLLNRITEHEDIGIITPHILENGQTWFKHGWVNRQTANSYAGELAKYLKQDSCENSGLIYNDYVPFCCTLFPTDVFKDIGLLSTSYFMYSEDVEFCSRAIKAGYEVVTDTTVSVEHKPSSSSGGAHNPLLNYYLARNRWILSQELECTKYRFIPSYIMWFVMRSLLSVLNRKRNGLYALYQGLFDGLLGKRGKGRYP